MIKVKTCCDVITVTGHAKHNDFGKDIVCASVSSILYTTVNAIMLFSEDLIEFSDEEVFSITTKKHSKEVDLLILNMLNLLSELERQYPKNLKIIK